MYNKYTKLKFLEGFVASIATKLKKAAPRFELGIKDLQSSALPLGHAAEKDSIESFNDLNSKLSHSLLFICNGHGEDVIASEIIKLEKRISTFARSKIFSTSISLPKSKL